MAQCGIREFDAKLLLARNLQKYSSEQISVNGKLASVTPETDLKKLGKGKGEEWLNNSKLVVKPDQLFGKRGKHGLILLNADLKVAVKFIEERMNKLSTVGKTAGTLTHFLIEPFIPHEKEYYVTISTERDNDVIFFSTQGGIDVEENWSSVVRIEVPVGSDIEKISIEEKMKIPAGEKKKVASFIRALYKFFVDFGFTFFEINPATIVGDLVVPLDVVARVDDAAAFECEQKWGQLEFPPAFGLSLSKEEQFIQSLDEKSGASLKLTVLNPEGRIWTMVAGGGASVIYADTIVDLGFGGELANYGEYSGDPNTEETYQYAKTVLDLMTRKKHAKGKVLLIGGGIANFTDVANTFKGIIQALREFKDKLKENNVKIFVRRGGPNYEVGLKLMKSLEVELGVPIQAFGPETHMTKIISLSLKN